MTISIQRGAAPGVPVGIICMWSGNIATIPDDWALCDGTANAPGPDLRDKFVVGARQDEAGVAKTNIEGVLEQTGGVTGHLHSVHGDLTHAGGAVADHTGLTHSLAVADHPDLTHAALSHAALTFTHNDHAVASVSHTHAAVTLTHADHSVPSFTGSDVSRADLSMPSGTHTHAAITLTIADHSVASFTGSQASGTFSVPSGTGSIASHTHSLPTLGVSVSSQGIARTLATGSAVQSAPSQSLTIASSTGTVASGTHTHAAATLTHANLSVPSFTGSQASGAAVSLPSQTHTHAAITLTHADHSVASITGSGAATTLTHIEHSFPSLSHQSIGTHVGTDYGVHAITAPAAHGAAGTLVHAFTEPDDHAISPHDIVSNVPSFFALAFIQKMAA